MNKKYAPLFEPAYIGKLKIKNKMAMAPMDQLVTLIHIMRIINDYKIIMLNVRKVVLG